MADTATTETQIPAPEPEGGSFEELWGEIPAGKAPTDPVPDTEPAPEAETAAEVKAEAPEEEKPAEEPEAAEEEKPEWLLAMARRKAKQADKRIAEVEAHAKQLGQAYEQFQAEHRAFIEERKALASLVQQFPTDFAGAFDQMARLAGMDPLKAFEQVARAKVGKKTEDVREKPPQIPKELTDRLAHLERQLQERDTVEQQHRYQSTVSDYSTKLYQVIESSTLPLKHILSDPDVQDSIPGAVQEWISTPEFRNMPLAEVAKRLDRYWESRDTAAQKRYSARAGSPAGQPAKPPTNGRKPSGSIPSNAESAETVGTREKSEYERLAEAGDMLLKELSGD